MARRLPADATQQAVVLRIVGDLDGDPAIRAVSAQDLLPEGVDELEVFSAISPNKHVNGVGEVSVRRLALLRPGCLATCTAEGLGQCLTPTAFLPPAATAR